MEQVFYSGVVGYGGSSATVYVLLIVVWQYVSRPVLRSSSHHYYSKICLGVNVFRVEFWGIKNHGELLTPHGFLGFTLVVAA